MKLSIVSTLYKSEDTCVSFVENILKESKKLFYEVELILVDDGSPDKSVRLIEQVFHENKDINIVQLSRNFGHHHALMAGLSLSKGDLIFIIDSDLEESPKLINQFYEKFQKLNCDVVYGYQNSRKGGMDVRVFGFLFYKIFNFLSNIKLKKNICVVRLMTREYVNSLLEIKDKALFLAGAWEIIGYRQIGIQINKDLKNKTTYTFKRKLLQALTAISSFSTRPLTLIFIVGLITIIFGTILFLYNIYKYFITNSVPEGYMTLFTLQIISLGLIVFSQGIIAIYISTILKELKNRPNYIIRKIYNP